MLHELSINNLGVIESARLEFAPGFTVITGETGAGKTMVLTGLGLILGAKGTAAVVRHGASEASVDVVVDYPRSTELSVQFEELGVSQEDDNTVIATRSVGASGRSRAIIGGRTVPQGLLGDFSETWVTVHGQADQGRLRSPSVQRAILDSFVGPEHRELISRYRQQWTLWNEAKRALTEAIESADATRARFEQLRDDLAAIEAVDPQPGEDIQLAADLRISENSEELRLAVVQGLTALDGEEEFTVITALNVTRRALADAQALDESLEVVVKSVDEAFYVLEDAALTLRRYTDSIDNDPVRLEAFQQRRSEILGLQRRLGTDFAGVLAARDALNNELQNTGDWDSHLQDLTQRESRARESVEKLAQQISDGRQRGASELTRAVIAELKQLAMPDAAIHIDVKQGELGPFGLDTVTVLLTPHQGSVPRPVTDAASGGELSRIMLAIEVAIAGNDHQDHHTFVFDEVDAGVGGKAALAVGQRLSQLARTHQVVVVTHLAQVAAYADHHLVVAKNSSATETVTTVQEVTGEGRLAEMARLLSGQEESSTARAHAQELLDVALQQ